MVVNYRSPLIVVRNPRAPWSSVRGPKTPGLLARGSEAPWLLAKSMGIGTQNDLGGAPKFCPKNDLKVT